MSVKIVGGDQYVQAVNKMAERVPQAARDTVKRYTVATQAQSVRLEPVKTGFLKRNKPLPPIPERMFPSISTERPKVV